MASTTPKFAAASCVFAVCLSLQLIASAQTPLIASGRPNPFPVRAANLSVPTGLYTRQTDPPKILLATLKPGLVWQRVRPADGNVGGPVLYQLIFSAVGTPGTLVKFDTNPRHLTNSLISEGGGQINFGGIVNFFGGQTFPGTGKVNSITGGTFITLGGTAIDPTIDLNTVQTDLRYATLAALSSEIAARTAADLLKANLSGGNNFSGNQAISGNLTATAFFGDGSGLSNIPRLTGGNSFKGNSTLGSSLSLLPEGVSSSGAGFQSGGVEFVASSFSSATALPVDQLFRWQVLPIGNNTATPGGKLNLLFASGSPLCDPTRLPPNVCQSTPVATGFWFNSDGTMNFAPGQTFPVTGTAGGTVTQVNTGAGLSGGPITGSGTITNTGVLSFNGRSGSVIPQTGDYNFAQITGTVAASQLPSNGAFLPLAGGTLTGALFGTTSSFNSATNTISSLTSATAGTGVFSHAVATTGSASGIFGQSDSTGGTGVFGQSQVAAGSVAGSTGNGVFGTTNGAGGIGVSGQATDQTGLDASNNPIGSDGVDGGTASPYGNGVSGFASCGPTTGCPADNSPASTSKGGTGVFGQSVSPWGAGMSAFAFWPPSNCGTPTNPTCDPQSGGPVGIFATARSAQGVGVIGNAPSILAANDTTQTPPGPPIARGGAAGVIGVSRSPNGVGMVGVATWPPVGCGTIIPNCNPALPPIGVAGVYGIVRRTVGAGVFGEADTLSASAGIFDNAAGTQNSPKTTDCITAGVNCNVLIAQANEQNVFRVDGAGNFVLDHGGAMSFLVDDDPTTPTVVNQLAELSPTSGFLANAGTNTAVGTLGVVIAKLLVAGVTKPQLAVFGTANCIFDDAEVQADYVIKSTTVAGQCHDAGTNYPVGVQVVGRAIKSVAAGAVGMIVLFPAEERQGGGAVLSTSGSPIPTGHSVTGTTTIGSTVTLTASAVFTDATSYVCQARDTTNAAGVTSVSYVSGTQFSITGVTTDAVRFTCTGQ